MKALLRDRRGFTALEAVIAFSLLALITTPVITIWYTSFFYPARLQSKTLAAHDIEQAEFWLRRDIATGPAGNNLGTLSKVSLAIGSSPGLSGDNALTVTYRTWSSPGSTSPTTSTITYDLEALDSTAGAYQLVRTDPSGAKRVVAAYIASAGDVVFSGSAASSAPGSPPQGVTLTMTSTVGTIPVGVASQSATMYFEPRVYQPLTTPTPASSQTWIAELPTFLYPKTGYYTVITTEGTGTIQAVWGLTGAVSVSVSIYIGSPLGTTIGDSITVPSKVSATLVATNAATTTNLTVTSPTVVAGTYTVYFFNAESQNYAATGRGNATVTYVSSSIP
ncbi:MAG: hypothetical protein HY684_02005 [Chloroflexi bacterium]|nr:hypothetical protein [Chloroflexota bacterium]